MGRAAKSAYEGNVEAQSVPKKYIFYGVTFAAVTLAHRSARMFAQRVAARQGTAAERVSLIGDDRAEPIARETPARRGGLAAAVVALALGTCAVVAVVAAGGASPKSARASRSARRRRRRSRRASASSATTA